MEERMIGAMNSEALKRLQEACGENEPKLLTEWHPVYTDMVPAAEYSLTQTIIPTQK